MLEAHFGVIKSIKLPDSFARGETLNGGMRQNWRRSFHPREKKDSRDVSITSLFRGSPTPFLEASTFRKVLAQPPGLIFSSAEDSQHLCHPEAPLLINEMAEALGNAGNNQFTNFETGVGGPRFCLQRMEVLAIGGRNVLAVYGIFHNSKMEPQAYFCGLFIDAAPDKADCAIEELVFEAQTKELYEKYRLAFERALSTIQWA